MQFILLLKKSKTRENYIIDLVNDYSKSNSTILIHCNCNLFTQTKTRGAL